MAGKASRAKADDSAAKVADGAAKQRKRAPRGSVVVAITSWVLSASEAAALAHASGKPVSKWADVAKLARAAVQTAAASAVRALIPPAVESFEAHNRQRTIAALKAKADAAAAELAAALGESNAPTAAAPAAEVAQ